MTAPRPSDAEETLRTLLTQSPDAAPARPTAHTRKRSAIVRTATLEASRPHFERAIGMLMLIVSFAGTVALFNGGWTPTLRGALGTGALLGFGLQAICTAVEWMYRRRRFSLPYLAALALDAGATALSYYPLFGLSVAAAIAPSGLGDSAASVLSWAIIGMASILLAMLPEASLID